MDRGPFAFFEGLAAKLGLLGQGLVRLLPVMVEL
jgi:hypothetical protein